MSVHRQSRKLTLPSAGQQNKKRIMVKIYWEGRTYDQSSWKSDLNIVKNKLGLSGNVWYGSCDCGGVFANAADTFHIVYETRHGECTHVEDEDEDDDVGYPLEKYDSLDSVIKMLKEMEVLDPSWDEEDEEGN